MDIFQRSRAFHFVVSGSSCVALGPLPQISYSICTAGVKEIRSVATRAFHTIHMGIRSYLGIHIYIYRGIKSMQGRRDFPPCSASSLTTYHVQSSRHTRPIQVWALLGGSLIERTKSKELHDSAGNPKGLCRYMVYT